MYERGQKTNKLVFLAKHVSANPSLIMIMAEAYDYEYENL
jgi:hypothetical protein